MDAAGLEMIESRGVTVEDLIRAARKKIYGTEADVGYTSPKHRVRVPGELWRHATDMLAEAGRRRFELWNISRVEGRHLTFGL